MHSVNNVHVQPEDTILIRTPMPNLSAGALVIGDFDAQVTLYPPTDPAEALVFLSALIEQAFELGDEIAKYHGYSNDHPVTSDAA